MSGLVGAHVDPAGDLRRLPDIAVEVRPKPDGARGRWEKEWRVDSRDHAPQDLGQGRRNRVGSFVALLPRIPASDDAFVGAPRRMKHQGVEIHLGSLESEDLAQTKVGEADRREHRLVVDRRVVERLAVFLVWLPLRRFAPGLRPTCSRKLPKLVEGEDANLLGLLANPWVIRPNFKIRREVDFRYFV